MSIAVRPEHIALVLNRLTSEGHDGFLVGGCVRDAVMDRPIHDWDLATSATPVEVARLFPKTVLTGERFGTVTVVLPQCSVEVTTLRAESDYNDGRHPEAVMFVSNIAEDLSRRDFTINAMAESVDGELIDPFDGVSDIKNKLIRCVGGPNTRFSEDALRMFRAMRFSAVLGFTIETETMQAIYANAGMASSISAERVQAELEKILLSNRPEIAGEMIKIGLLDRYISLSGKNPGTLGRIARLPQEPILRWCAFCAILLDKQTIRSATEFLYELHLDGKTIKTCLRALTMPDFPEDRVEIKRALSTNGAAVVRAAAAMSDVFNETGSLKKTDDILESGECATLEELAITGRDLLSKGHSPGRGLGETLHKLLGHVLKHPGDNTRERLLELIEEWAKV